MRTYNLLSVFVIIFLTCFNAAAQETYRSEVMRSDIKSLQVKIEGEMISSPFIELNGEKRIEISFDALHHTSGRYAYSVIHCDADWKKSILIPLEYMRGFQNVPLNDFSFSISTTTNYTNYKLFLPNDDTQFTVSGNYVVQIYDENNPDNIILNACFSVVEPLININASISGNTDIDFNKEHQQIEFTIDKKNINIAYPQTDLKIFVYQNNNINDMRTNIHPMTITTGQLQYKRNRALIFEAGNEYRRIEFLTHRYKGMGVEEIGYYDPYYHITLYSDRIRSNRAYFYDEDQNGRFFVHCSGCQDPDTEADYYVVHFSLQSQQLTTGNVYLLGDMFNNIIDNNSVMEYNIETGAYEKSVMLKLGNYNYQYAFVEDGGTKVSLRQIEGNFHETENEYTIAVYYRPIGSTKYDRLIGVANVRKH